MWTHRWTGWGWERRRTGPEPQLENVQGSIFGTHSTPDLSFPDPSTLSSQLHTKGPCVGAPGDAMHLYIIASPPQSLGMNCASPGAGDRKGGAGHQTGARGQKEAAVSSPLAPLPHCLFDSPPLSILLPTHSIPLSPCSPSMALLRQALFSLPPSLPLCPPLAGLQTQGNLETEPIYSWQTSRTKHTTATSFHGAWTQGK